MLRPTPVLLTILDGFGYREGGEDNAIAKAAMPHWQSLWAHYPHAIIQASEAAVGLPTGQFGNSEVGHLNIGAGRIVQQDITRIDADIAQHQFKHNPAITRCCKLAARRNATLHLLGLVSDGGIHSHERHLFALIRTANSLGVNAIAIHAFLDGRDTPPKIAASYISRLEEICAETNSKARIASIVGRFYAMDRDQRWERIAPVYRMLSEGQADFQAASAQQALNMAYERGETDEFVQATIIGKPGTIQPEDVVFFFNFRADRARQLTQALTWEAFDGFPRPTRPKMAAFGTLTSYGADYPAECAYAPNALNNTFGEYLSNLGLTQLRMAETEKYPHVTYFFSGGQETLFPGETRILIPSPKVRTYDLQPEMSAAAITAALEEAIESRRYDAIIVNYANADMVGHSGMLRPTVEAIEALDAAIGTIVAAMQQIGGETLITADHGNAEQMFDPLHHQPHTQHTTNPVPVLYVGRPAKLRTSGALQDIAPTLLTMMGLAVPREMTGHSLIEAQTPLTA